MRGDELAQALGIKPGPVVGDLLAELEAASFSGEVATREEAIARARELIASGAKHTKLAAMSDRDPDCLFCKIVAGEIPSERVDEDERTVAFMDINPATRGHALVVPRRHAANLLEIDPEDLAATVAAAQRLARAASERLGADGVNLLNSCGAAAWQTVFHFHIHVIPRYEDDPLRLPWMPVAGRSRRDRGRRRAAAMTGAGAGAAVSVTREDGLAVVTFDSPPLNLFDAAMSDGLDAAVDRAGGRPPAGGAVPCRGPRGQRRGRRVAVRRAVGPREAEGVFAGLVAVARRVDRLPCPTVFAAHALCLTWAFELALACDLILAAESASFGLVEKVIGLTPAMGGTQRLAERAGTGRAREFVMAGRPFGAAELERWNVVNRVLPDDGFDAAARELRPRARAGADAGARRDQAGAPRLPRGRGRAGQRAGPGSGRSAV